MADERQTSDLETARRTDRTLEVLLDRLGRDATAGRAATSECPEDIGQWHELALGALEPSQARRLEAHADACPFCATDRELARSFAEDIQTDGRAGSSRSQSIDEPSRAFPLRAPQRTALALAATVLIAVLGLLWVRSMPRDLPPVGAPGSGSEIRSGAEVALLAPVGTLSEVPRRLSWRSTLEGAQFLVQVQRVDAQVVFERRTGDLHLELSEEERASLQSDVTYTWFVRAELGERSAQSAGERFVIRPDTQGDAL